MLHRFLFHNDRVLPVEQIRLSPGQTGLLSGWGLFTTIRVVQGVPFAFERHWKRLARDAERTHCPFPFKEDTIQAHLDELLAANQVREGCVRIYVIYNQVGLWRSQESFPQADLLICSTDLPSYQPLVRLGLREHGRHAGSPLAGVKVISWLNNVWNLYEAQQAGFDETILLNERGEVAECTAANIFCLRQGRVRTPPLSSGCLSGITRSILLEIGAGAGMPIEESPLFPEDLYAAEEVFITSTNRNLLPVVEVNGHRISPSSHSTTAKLEEMFSLYVRNYLVSHAAAAGKR